MRGISRLAEDLLTSLEVLCSMELVTAVGRRNGQLIRVVRPVSRVKFKCTIEVAVGECERVRRAASRERGPPWISRMLSLCDNAGTLALTGCPVVRCVSYQCHYQNI